MKILIIQQKMIGDVLISSLLFEVIKQQYPSSILHYLINNHTQAVIENNPYIDCVHLFTSEHEKNKLQLLKLALSLRKENYDIVIDVYSKISSSLITFFSGASKKISYDKSYNFLIYNHRFKINRKTTSNTSLAIENRVNLLQPINIKIKEYPRPKIYLTNQERTNAQLYLNSNGIDFTKPLFMIGVLGSSAIKTYPFQEMAKVLDTLVKEKPNCNILFNYIPSQKEDVLKILNLCSLETQQKVLIDVYGKSLREFMAITSFCNALIGNEGGATNMAKALNVPTFTIFSPWIQKEAWAAFEKDNNNVAIHLEDYRKKFYANVEDYRILKTKAETLYKEFKFSLFKQKLKSFINQF